MEVLNISSSHSDESRARLEALIGEWAMHRAAVVRYIFLGSGVFLLSLLPFCYTDYLDPLLIGLLSVFLLLPGILLKPLTQTQGRSRVFLFVYTELLNGMLLRYALVDYPEFTLLWSLAGFQVFYFYESFQLMSVFSIVFNSSRISLQWLAVAVYNQALPMPRTAHTLLGVFAVVALLIASIYFEQKQSHWLCDANWRTHCTNQKLTTLITRTPIGILVISKDYELLHINDKARAFLAFTSLPELLQMPFSTPGAASSLKEIDKFFYSKQETVQKLGILKVQERLVEVSGSLAPWEHSEVVILTVQDISDLYELEKAKEGNKNKTRILRTVNHELRNPLNSILYLVDELYSELSDRRLVTKVALLRNSCQHLLFLVNDFLDFSQIIANTLQLTLTYFDVRETIEEVVQLVTFQASCKNNCVTQSICSSVPRFIKSDPYRLKQVLFNLLGNANKFTTKGNIQVTVKYFEGELYVEVKDTGVGIPTDKLSSIFKEFTQLRTHAHLSPLGAGLGLYISNKIVKALSGGEGLLVHSLEGRGSTFGFVLNVKAKMELHSPKSPSRDCLHFLKPAEQCVLVVDDTAFNQYVYRSAISSLGYTCDCASDGQEAVAIIRANPYKYVCVFMDNEMPLLSGIAATIQLHELAEQGTIPRLPPIVGLFGDWSQKIYDECLQLGMLDVLRKPTPKQDLIRVLAEL